MGTGETEKGKRTVREGEVLEEPLVWEQVVEKGPYGKLESLPNVRGRGGRRVLMKEVLPKVRLLREVYDVDLYTTGEAVTAPGGEPIKRPHKVSIQSRRNKSLRPLLLYSPLRYLNT